MDVGKFNERRLYNTGLKLDYTSSYNFYNFQSNSLILLDPY